MHIFFTNKILLTSARVPRWAIDILMQCWCYYWSRNKIRKTQVDGDSGTGPGLAPDVDDAVEIGPGLAPADHDEVGIGLVHFKCICHALYVCVSE
jgi:hypothetical protein